LVGSGGRSGSTAAHSAFETRGLAMPNQPTHASFVRRSNTTVAPAAHGLIIS
jgi:hypothetical protein